MKITRRIFSLLLAVLLILPALPALPLAAEEYSPFYSLEVEPITLVENIDSFESEYWDDDLGEWVPFRCYDSSPRSITLTMKDGTVLTGTPWDVAEQLGIGDDYYSYDDQRGNPWGVGEHTATLCMAGFTVPYTVTIEESPFLSLEVEPITLVEGMNGYEDWFSDPDADVLYPYFLYITTPRALTLTMKDGSVITGEIWEIRGSLGGRFDYSITDDQWGNPWGPGEHTAVFHAFGFDVPYTVTIVENPIASVSTEPISLLKNTGGYWYEDYDGTLGEWVDCYHYDYEPNTLTVTLKDGTVLTGDRWKISDAIGMDCNYELSDDQWSTPWDVGEHQVTLSVFGVQTTVTVTVEESIILSLEVEPFTVIENIDGWESEYRDDVTGTWYTYFRYAVEPRTVTVTLKDGTVLTGNVDEVCNALGFPCNYGIEDNQHRSPWSVGEHQVTLSMLGIETTYTVTVVENPVASIEIAPVSVMEGTNLTERYYWDNEQEEWFPYACYDVYFNDVTLTMKDGRVFTGSIWSVINDAGFNDGYDIIDDQQENPWGVGEHHITLRVLGMKVDVTVNILENPVAAVEVAPITVREGIDSYERRLWDPETGEYLPYLHYNSEPDRITVTLKDGTVCTGTIWQIMDQIGLGGSYDIYDGQEDEPWDVGEHQVILRFYGVETTYTVTVRENPIASLEVAPVSYVKDTQGWVDSYWDEEAEEWVEYFWYYVIPEQLTVTLKDGRVFTGNGPEIYEALGIPLNPNVSFDYNVSDDQDRNPWGLGDHTATLYFLGQTATFTVSITDSPIASVEAEPLTIWEYTHGYVDWYHETGADEAVSFYRYTDFHEMRLTVTLKDGSVYTGTLTEIFNESGLPRSYLVNAPQPYSARWGLGEHQAIITYCGCEFILPIVIVENPVEKIEVEPLVYRKGTGMELRSYWDYRVGEYVECLIYPTTPTHIVITMKDGSVVEGSLEEIAALYNLDAMYLEEDDQWRTPWDVGTHTLWMYEFLGFNVSYDIVITEKEPEDPDVLFGDINGDGVLSIGDVSALLMEMSEQELAPGRLAICDLNGDGTLSIGDVSAMLMLL